MGAAAATRKGGLRQRLFDGSASVHASASPLIVPLPFFGSFGSRSRGGARRGVVELPHAFFLSFAAKEGFVIASYDDCAIGILDKTTEGKEWARPLVFRKKVSCKLASGSRPLHGRLRVYPLRMFGFAMVARSLSGGSS